MEVKLKKSQRKWQPTCSQNKRCELPSYSQKAKSKWMACTMA